MKSQESSRPNGAKEPNTGGARAASRQSSEKFINRGRLYWWCWRAVMKWAHRHHWHYAKPIDLHGGDVQLWCQWCGFRDTIARGPKAGAIDRSGVYERLEDQSQTFDKVEAEDVAKALGAIPSQGRGK